MDYQLPYEAKEFLQSELTSEKASKLIAILEKSLQSVSFKASDIALQKKLEIKDELAKELASKSDVNILKSELHADIRIISADLKVMDARNKLYFGLLLATIIVINKDSLVFIAQLIGLVK